jgi:membrane protein
VFVVLVILMLGALAAGTLTVVATALPGQPGVQRAAAVLGTALAVFALLYLVGQALVYAAEVAAVRYARLWPRALDLNRPTAADSRVLALLAREQERIPAARVEFHLAERDSPPVPGGSPPASEGPE